MSCNKKGKLNPFFGKKHSQELKDRLSKERKGVWCVGENNPMFGKSCYYNMTPEEKQQWQNNISKSTAGENNPMFGKKLLDIMGKERFQQMKDNQRKTIDSRTPEKRQEISETQSKIQQKLKAEDPEGYSEMKRRAGRASSRKQSFYKMTIPEKMVEAFLKEHNVNYDYSCIMGSDEKCFQYDFIIHGKRVLIEVQGDYWHGNPLYYNLDGSHGKTKLNEVQLKNLERDKRKLQFAIDKKFKAVFIWETEIKNNDFSKILKVI